MFGFFSRPDVPAEQPHVALRARFDRSSKTEPGSHLPQFDSPPGPPRPTLLRPRHVGHMQKMKVEQPLPASPSPTHSLKDVIDSAFGCGRREDHKVASSVQSYQADLEAPSSPKLQDGIGSQNKFGPEQTNALRLANSMDGERISELNVQNRLDEICSQLAALTHKVEQHDCARIHAADAQSFQVRMSLDARLSDFKAELLKKGWDHNKAHSFTHEFHDAIKILSGKLEAVTAKVGGVFEAHGHSLKLMSDRMAQLDSQIEAMKEDFDFLQKLIKNELLLGSSDHLKAFDDKLTEPEQSQKETAMAGNESLTKTRQVRFVDLGAAQLQPTQFDFDRPRNTLSFKERLSKSIASLPEYGPLHSCHSPLTLLSTLLVALNAVFIGVSVDQTLQALLNDETPPRWIDTVEVVFAVALAIDLTLRILAWGKAFFVDKSERMWNLFDFLLCCAAISEPLFPSSDSGTSRNFPALRIFRALRVFRVVRQFGTLRLMLAMITHAMNNVMWAFVFILMLTYMVAVMFMQVITNKVDEYRQQHPSAWMEYVRDGMPGDWSENIAASYGTLSYSCITLVASISGGVDWVDASWPLYQVQGIYLVIYLVFVMFCVFGLMNILTGIFVANTKEVSRIDRDLVIRSQLNDRMSFANQLKKIMRSVDKDDTGTISKQELMDHLTSDETDAYLKTLDVTVSDAQGVFKLLDVTGTGEVNIDEFVLSMMRFQGGARAVDVATLIYEGKRSEARWNAYMDYIEEQFNVLKARLHIDSSKTGSVETHVGKARLVNAFSIPLGNAETK